MLPRFFALWLVFMPWMANADSGAHHLTIGVLAFGTVNWELAAIHNEGLDRKYGLDLEVKTLASPEAGKIGLRAGSVDVIATDWIWVAQQQQTGADYRFIPYSTHAGALMAPAGSPIKGVADLAGKRLGIAGGALDKNWAMLRALAQKDAKLDLNQAVDKVFGAPPLLNQQLRDGKLDALLDLWHYAAKLEAQGYRRVLDGREALQGLGISEPLPNLGYVFKQSWAGSHAPALDAFLKAAGEARNLLCESDSAWQKILPLTDEPDVKLQGVLRREYCAGKVKSWGEAEKRDVAKLYALLRQTGGAELIGKAEKLPAEIFWPYELKP
ncbi:ABC transporter substrate-binding protein [Methylococcus sp. EFPC2]|uniref:ABC transporter substrate-binding protein n=1 Tax=Methylococcus sp. EFPC2 TaxID=2812648 RepID=UPI00196718CB|nr:ABC transporter substrate-binding protein [Methylococcus sp. EFPC2]QSA95906.1 ABC transporter substrate-binding protein [Methylococcus sp. EFPC2]